MSKDVKLPEIPQTENFESGGNDPSNPFVHNLNISRWNWLKVILLTVFVFPVRVVLILFFTALAWVVCRVGLAGTKPPLLQEHPLLGWRAELRKVACFLLRCAFFCGGFYRIKVKGERADVKEVPIICLAPHSSYFDALAVIYLGGPSVVAKAESQAVPFWGTFINYSQPILVYRNDPNSRLNTIRAIERRCTSADQGWSQVAIFPEGTCTNRSCLITFRLGAFYPGAPIQPVCIRYENALDTVTWTWEGPSALRQLWLSLSQFYVSCELEYLPPYYPSREETGNPPLYANNFRAYIARELNLPTTDCTYFDYLKIEEAQKTLALVQKVQDKLRGTTDLYRMEEEVLAKCATDGVHDVTPEDFLDLLGLSGGDPDAAALFANLAGCRGDASTMDVRHYFVVVNLVSRCNAWEVVRAAFIDFDPNERGVVSHETFGQLMKLLFYLSEKEIQSIIQELDVNKNGQVNFYEFFNYVATRKTSYNKILKCVEGKLVQSSGLSSFSASLRIPLSAEVMTASLAAGAGAMSASFAAAAGAGKEVVSEVLNTGAASLAAGKEAVSASLAASKDVVISKITEITGNGHKKSKSE